MTAKTVKNLDPDSRDKGQSARRLRTLGAGGGDTRRGLFGADQSTISDTDSGTDSEGLGEVGHGVVPRSRALPCSTLGHAFAETEKTRRKGEATCAIHAPLSEEGRASIGITERRPERRRHPE
uniref:Uncharacterized protein n=1 Tax=Steinernema glaseri TaxID=37863 RepID=A0A1I7ZEQ3_9BILA